MSDQVKRNLDKNFEFVVGQLNLAFDQAVHRADDLLPATAACESIELVLIDLNMEGEANIGLAIGFEDAEKGEENA